MLYDVMLTVERHADIISKWTGSFTSGPQKTAGNLNLRDLIGGEI